MARSAKQLTFSLNAVGLLSMFLELTVCLMGFILLVKSPDIDPSYGFMHFIGNYLGIGIKGFLIAGLLAGLCCMNQDTGVELLFARN